MQKWFFVEILCIVKIDSLVCVQSDSENNAISIIRSDGRRWQVQFTLPQINQVERCMIRSHIPWVSECANPTTSLSCPQNQKGIHHRPETHLMKAH